jgi:hypothetical protein
MLCAALFLVPIDVKKTCILDIDNQLASLLVDQDIHKFIESSDIKYCNTTIDNQTYKLS